MVDEPVADLCQIDTGFLGTRLAMVQSFVRTVNSILSRIPPFDIHLDKDCPGSICCISEKLQRATSIVHT